MYKILSASLAVGVLMAGAASAGTATANFNVTATVAAACTATAPNLQFGTYTPGTAAAYLTGSTIITLTCTKGAQPTVALSAGGGAFTQRLMASAGTPANKLAYQLYTATTTTGTGVNVWGDGTGATKTVQTATAAVGTGTPLTLTVYGLILDSMGTNTAAVPATDYTDTITANITY
jgi:spore coat protein U-like protein